MDYLGGEMRALCERYVAEEAALPEPINSCRLHPDALLWQRTWNGRQGCVGCLTDPGNLDAHDADPGVDVDAGETRCPGCRVSVVIRETQSGVWLAYDPDGHAHRHRQRRT